jgi:hypothetical protein
LASCHNHSHSLLQCESTIAIAITAMSNGHVSITEMNTPDISTMPPGGNLAKLTQGS